MTPGRPRRPAVRDPDSARSPSLRLRCWAGGTAAGNWRQLPTSALRRAIGHEKRAEACFDVSEPREPRRPGIEIRDLVRSPVVSIRGRFPPPAPERPGVETAGGMGSALEGLSHNSPVRQPQILVSPLTGHFRPMRSEDRHPTRARPQSAIRRTTTARSHLSRQRGKARSRRRGPADQSLA